MIYNILTRKLRSTEGRARVTRFALLFETVKVWKYMKRCHSRKTWEISQQRTLVSEKQETA